MTKSNGLPCKKCGTSEWNKRGDCKECGRNRDRQWKKANSDTVADKKRRYHADNADKRANYDRRYRQENPGIVANRKRRWQQANPDKANATTNRRRTRKTEAGGSYTAAEFRALCDHYGNRCLRCGCNNVKLTADHIKPVSKGGSSNIDNIQPLCKPCNISKYDRDIDYRPDAGPLRWLQAKLFG